MSDALTFYFSDIIPDVESWQEFLTDFDVLTITDDNRAFVNQMFKYLDRRFHNSNVQYDTPYAFKSALANRVEDVWGKYARQRALAEKINDLTDDDLQQLSFALANAANNPNDVPDDPLKPLEYISNQSTTYAKMNKLQAFVIAIKNVQTQLIQEFIDDCKPLFKSIFTPPGIVYVND